MLSFLLLVTSLARAAELDRGEVILQNGEGAARYAYVLAERDDATLLSLQRLDDRGICGKRLTVVLHGEEVTPSEEPASRRCLGRSTLSVEAATSALAALPLVLLDPSSFDGQIRCLSLPWMGPDDTCFTTEDRRLRMTSGAMTVSVQEWMAEDVLPSQLTVQSEDGESVSVVFRSGAEGR